MIKDFHGYNKSKDTYAPYKADKTPHLFKNFTHYAYKAHDSFYPKHDKEGICTFGLSEKTWLKLWKWSIMRKFI